MAEGLLHLGAMAVLTGTVYLNLDKASPTPEDPTEVVEGLRGRVREWSKDYDLEYTYIPEGKTKRRPCRTYDSGKGYFLLSFVKHPACKCFRLYQRAGYGLFNFIFHPTSSMIGDGYHRVVAGIFTLLSAVCFFCEIGGPILGFDYYLFDDKTLFTIYLVTVLIVIFFARLSRRLTRLEITLNIMMGDLSREKKHEDDKVRGKMRDNTSASSTKAP